MPIFEYRATDIEGNPVQGTMSGASLTAAGAELEKRGYRIDHLAVAQMPGDPIPADFGREGASSAAPAEGPDIMRQRSYVETHVVGQFVGRVPLNDLMFFFRQLATMLQAGIGMVQALTTLKGQTQDSRLKEIIGELAEHARQGRPLSFGMQRYPEAFSPLVLSLIRVGETSGVLDETLRQITAYLEREIKLRNNIRRQTLYPKIVIGASIVIILVTNMIITAVGGGGMLSSPLTNPITWVFLGPLIAGLWLFTRLGLPNPRIKHNWDQFVQKIPYLGETVRQMAMAKYGRAMAALYRGGVGIPESTQLAADACGSEFIRAKIYPAIPLLKDGQSITTTYVQTGAFNPIVIDMIQTGETTGNLDMMLDKMADFFEDESETRSNVMANVLGVVCLVGVGVYIGFIVIGFYVGRIGGIMDAAN